MRIGFFTECYHPIVNGIVASIDGLAAGLRDLGHEVYCFAPSVPGYEEGESAVLRIPSLPLPTAAPYRLTVPVVSRRNRHAILNRLDVLHAHSMFVTGWMAARYARRLHLPLVYTYHTRLEEYAHYVPFDEDATRRAASRLTRNYANLAQTVIVPTADTRDRLREHGVTVPIEVVPSGIDLERFAAGTRRDALRRAAGVREGERMLLFVSRLAREKNVELLIDALALCTVPAHLVVAGDGPERRALEERARERGAAGRVTFLGAVERALLPDYYASADAFVFASTTETQGLVLAEAMAAGTPVIACDAPQLRDVVGAAATLVPATPDAFARAMAGVPLVPDRVQAEIARLQAGRFGVDEQSGRVAAIYSALMAAPKAAVGD